MHPENLAVGELFGVHHGFKVFTGERYLRGYIRNDKSKGAWLIKWTYKWERNIHAVIKTPGKYLQKSYVVVTRAI